MKCDEHTYQNGKMRTHGKQCSSIFIIKFLKIFFEINHLRPSYLKFTKQHWLTRTKRKILQIFRTSRVSCQLFSVSIYTHRTNSVVTIPENNMVQSPIYCPFYLPTVLLVKDNSWKGYRGTYKYLSRILAWCYNKLRKSSAWSTSLLRYAKNKSLMYLATIATS